MKPDVDLPPLPVIAAALRGTTERLAREVVDPQHTAPDWNELEWSVARAVSAMQGISGLLATRLIWRGPADWHEFLAQEHAQMLARDARIAQLLATFDSGLRAAGVAFVPLKGSATRHLGLYQPGERPQGDIDVLVRPVDLGRCGDCLRPLGYEQSFRTRRHDVYSPVSRVEATHFGESEHSPLKFEVHVEISEPLPFDKVDITDTIWAADPSPGANRYASLAALMRHLCLHAAGNMRANAVRFLHIHEIALLARRLSTSDWRELLGDGAGRTSAWWMYPSLALASNYLPGSIPPRLLAEFRAVCPSRLRRRYQRMSLYEVSWSNVRIAALPGLEWARSLGETWRFARSRAWPDRTAIDELALASVAQPALTSIRWYGASHAERIVRWVFTRPPRVQTMVSVRAAIAGGTRAMPGADT